MQGADCEQHINNHRWFELFCVCSSLFPSLFLSLNRSPPSNHENISRFFPLLAPNVSASISSCEFMWFIYSQEETKHKIRLSKYLTHIHIWFEERLFLLCRPNEFIGIAVAHDFYPSSSLHFSRDRSASPSNNEKTKHRFLRWLDNRKGTNGDEEDEWKKNHRQMTNIELNRRHHSSNADNDDELIIAESKNHHV